MDKHMLYYTLESKVYGFSKGFKQFSQNINGITISDEYSPNTNYDYVATGLGDYKIVLSALVIDKTDLDTNFSKIANLSKSLDVAWLYAAGHPLLKKEFCFMTNKIIPLDGTLPGWSNNYDTISKEISKGKARINISFNSISHSIFPFLLLERALSINGILQNIMEPFRTLSFLYYYAHKTEDGLFTIFLLSKCLELIRKILPGKNDNEKQKSLFSEVSKNIKYSLHELYELSNNRYETRHIFGTKKQLLPKMNTTELNYFSYDADLIIRSVICSNLNIDFFIINRN